MTHQFEDHEDLSADDWDEINFPRPDENDFDAVVDRAVSRRGFLSSALAFGSGACVMGLDVLAVSGAEAAGLSAGFDFTPIPAFTDNTVHVPEGYNWQVLMRWGDPLFDGVAGFDPAVAGDPIDTDRVFGENTDGMELFQVDGKQLIAINHEYTNRKINLPLGQDGKPSSAEDVMKLQNLQGVTVMEIAQGTDGQWSPVKNSAYTRRITHHTPMRIVGPAAGHDLLKTDADATGTQSLGTFNNCGSGRTPWGTYLTCEENFNGYFGATAAATRSEEVEAGYARYGIGTDGWGYDYHLWDSRFDSAFTPNEPHRAGWIVEIDPSDPTSTPVKHTGLGRFKHENAACTLAQDGRVVVYMGDDERGEFLYKFVSDGVYEPGKATEHLLNIGTLYAAHFNDDLTGEWRALTPDTTGMDAARIAIFARMAGSKVGATTMDRPEWVAVNPHKAEAYCALTNNKNRGKKPNKGGDATPASGPNPREANKYGQIVRWRPDGGDHGADTFEWDLYVMAGNPTVHSDARKGSDNVNPGNLFNAPDGMAFDSQGKLWIQTDGKDTNRGDFAGMGNNQMLVGDPATGEIVRFMTGPKGSEVTGLTWSLDRKTMFVGIQHPGGTWPDGGPLPRSSIIAIQRDDGAVIG